MALVRSVEGNLAQVLASGWRCAAAAPGRIADPSGLAAADLAWFEATVPGTAASALAAAGAWNLDLAHDFDDKDWWFVCKLATAPPAGARTVLRLGGLATLADVWIDGQLVLRASNMFLEHAIDPVARLAQGSEIAIRFGSIAEELKKRRPRPRWRAQTVAQQQLRWIRTTLLGRIPAWAPPAAPVGPYAPVVLESQTLLRVLSADARSRLEGGAGICDVELRLAAIEGKVEGVSLDVAGAHAALACVIGDDGAVTARGSVRVPDPALWWPFTHGAPALHDVVAHVQVAGRSLRVDLGRTGFRTIDVDETAGAFRLRVNGVEVFCRGACWTPLDVVGLTEPPAALGETLDAVCAAGMNMLRLNGTMLYGSTAFHDGCDARGILVWQDFMFANMDYPVSDEPFRESVRAEAEQRMSRIQLSPSLAVTCGNSEVEQQAAMLGLPAADWRNALFAAWLPAIVKAVRPDVAYAPSTPSGGPLPFRTDVGLSHYYGVGAYRRPFEDARRANVRFTPECLAFANLPSDEAIEELLDGAAPPNHPRWKARVPRDKGVGWDFDDVRDHYLQSLFGVDPTALRFADVPRYLELGRLASGEAMAAAIAEWRRAGSSCHGALVWFLRDLWLGAGWGVLDAHGRPKAAYYFLKRAFQPTNLMVTDEGLNGLSFHAVNETANALEGRIRLVLYLDGQTPVAEGESPVRVPARATVEVSADTLLGRFSDTAYAYRFGPPRHDVAVATLEGASGAPIAQAFHFPTSSGLHRSPDLGLEASARRSDTGDLVITLRTRKVARSVAFDVRGYTPVDDFFHLAPGHERTVLLRRRGGDVSATGNPSGRVLPVNAASATRIVLAT